MSFTKQENGDVVHTDGWGVRFEGRETCFYFEGDKVLQFEYVLKSKTDTFHFTPLTNKHWEDPHEDEKIPAKHWATIMARLKTYLEWDDDWKPFVIENYVEEKEDDDDDDQDE